MTYHLVTASDSNLRSNLKKYISWKMVCEFSEKEKKI